MQQMCDIVMDLETVGEEFFIASRLTVDGLIAGLVLNRRTLENLIALGLSACKPGSCLPGVFKNSITDSLTKHRHPLPSGISVNALSARAFGMLCMLVYLHGSSSMTIHAHCS